VPCSVTYQPIHTLNKIENGFEGVRLNTLLQIMEALGMEMNMKDWVWKSS